MSKRRCLLFCSAEFPPTRGGTGTYVYEMARGLHKLGWDMYVVTHQSATPNEITAFNAAQAFPILPMRSPSDLRSLFRAACILRPDLLVSFDLFPTWISWGVSALTRIPLVAVGIGSEFRNSPFLRRKLKQLIYSRCRHVVAISRFTATRMHSVGIHPRQLSIIYPGGNITLDQSNIDPTVLRDRYQLRGKRIILTMGALSPRKGQDVVIRAMPHVLRQYPDVHYLIVGRDRTEGAFAKLVDTLGLQANVTFTGTIPESEKAAFYQFADVCAITSRNTQVDVEGYGIVVIEAALCRRTTIGTRGTGIEEAIIDGETGLLIPQDDPIATAEALCKLLGDAELCQRLAANAYRRAHVECTWEARVKEFDRLCLRLLSGKD